MHSNSYLCCSGQKKSRGTITCPPYMTIKMQNGDHCYDSVTQWSKRDLIPPFNFLEDRRHQGFSTYQIYCLIKVHNISIAFCYVGDILIIFCHNMAQLITFQVKILTSNTTMQSHQGFFSKFLMGTQNFWSPPGTDGEEVGWGGLAKKSDWSRNWPPNAKLGHFLLF